MKARVLRDVLRAACEAAQRSTGKGAYSPLPVLKNLLLTAGDGWLEVAGTDLATYTCMRVPARVEEEGAVSVPGRVLVDLVKQLPSEAVELSCKLVDGVPGKLRLKCAGTKVNFKTIDAREFPLKQEKEVLLWEVEAERFLWCVGSVIYAVAEDESRPVLTAVHIVADGGEVRMESADGYRCAVVRESFPGDMSRKFIIPADALATVMKLGKGEETIRLYATQTGSLAFEVVSGAGTVEVFAQEVEGQFVRVEQIIPKTSRTHITCRLDELLKAMKVIGAVAKQDDIPRVSLTCEGERLVLCSQASEGMAWVDAEVDCVLEGDPAEVVMNYQYFNEALLGSEGDEVVLEMTANQGSTWVRTPVTIKPFDSAKYLSVVMPMHDTMGWQER